MAPAPVKGTAVLVGEHPMSNEVIKARIMTVMRNLPPLPEVTRRLLGILGDENASASDVSKILSSDQTLAGKVLKIVNSSFYGVQQEVKTISRAVVILGFAGVRKLAMGIGSVEALRKMGEELDMADFWEHAMANAVGAQSLALVGKVRVDPEEAFVAGLMHDIGSYVLAAAVPDAYAPILAENGPDRLTREFEATGFNHVQIGQGLLQFWELPEAFADAARNHHDLKVCTSGEQHLTTLVALADVLACVHGSPYEQPVGESELSQLMNAAGLSMDDIATGLDGMDEKILEMRDFMKIPGTATVPVIGLSAEENNSCVIVTNDDNRRDWTKCLLQHFGMKIFPMQPYFNQSPGSAEVRQILVDPQCLTKQQLDQLLPFLASQPVSVVMLADPDVPLPEVVSSYPRLSYVFSARDLAEAVALPIT